MADENAPENGDVEDDHLYVCRYGGGETISVGRDVGLWNEGLPESLSIRRDLGRIVHSWVVTEAGVQKVRMDHVTDEGTFVMIPTGQAQQTHSVVVEDADPTVQFPTELFTVSHVNTAVKGADPDEVAATPAELDELTENARAVVGAINEDIEAAFEARYDAWRADAGLYPEGRDFGYEIPLSAEWKRGVLDDRTDLTAAQVDLLATAGFPASMRVTVDVETPDAAEDRLD